MEDFWNTENWFGKSLAGDNVPAVNIKDLEKVYDIEVAAPGFQKEDFKVGLEHGTLSISAESKKENKEEDEHFTRKEFSYSSFNRSFTLPEDVKEDNIKAKYENGLLHLTLEKAAPNQAPKKSIQIE